MARRRRAMRKVKRYGKTFRTKAGRLGRYVYVGGKRVAFEAVRSGVRRAIAQETYRRTTKAFRKRRY
jgi:hypothetical protein